MLQNTAVSMKTGNNNLKSQMSPDLNTKVLMHVAYGSQTPSKMLKMHRQRTFAPSPDNQVLSGS
ncbi:hypothetical protein Anapl_07358 [Anas platyrhynchos]|uniref:Uncharacterized protein n=1 Tax=Anas platyrhynchos TaxID=8839 RepID=R0K1Z0_ANAPL|nr:hypothetical protein Anapl_07358 [Anas platyrhynchos]